ncbi:MAG: sigma 54-interacting transcriptional regulator [Longicatena sp.]
MKELVINELKKRCKENIIKENPVFTASEIADTLQISRNTVSQYLNEKVKEKEVVKINSRPVYFYDRKMVEEKFGQVKGDGVFASFQEFVESFCDLPEDFELLIGYNNSLHNVVEHCKAAITYPGGLPILIHGPTGTGKSMIASLMYEYALHQNIIDTQRKFVSVNCSEYANNPELLTANLFGHVKGAYTGADDDNPGLISLADGGILFLDEVHCLKAECQEKLFFFMDKGMYHKVGDNENWFHSKCRLIFATTEDPQNVLLKTLLRRIPITVTIPSLKERPLIEKRELIYTIFTNESKRLGKEIFISNLAYQSLMDFEFPGNIGAMKNAIKAACANAFLTNRQDNALRIEIPHLPDYIFLPMTTVQLKSSGTIQETMIPISKLKSTMNYASPFLHLYDRLLDLYEEYLLKDNQFHTFLEKAKEHIQSYIDYIMFSNRYRQNTNEDYLLKMLDKIYSIVMNKYSLAVPNSEIKIYSRVLVEYSKHVVDAKVWISEHYEMVEDMKNILKEKVPRSSSIANEVVDNVELNLDIELDDLLMSIITIAFIGYEHEESNPAVGVILCHGYSTASCIADTVNRMLGQYIFDGIDMEINISIDKVAQLADDYLKRKDPIQELMFLVDMGSLEEIYNCIKPISNCNIGLINNVSTAMALEVGNLLKQGQSAIEILEAVSSGYQLSTHYLEGKSKKNAILTVCATGFGAAQKISELLKSSLPHKIDLEIIPYDYQSLVENGTKDAIFSRYNVDLLIGTLDPKINDKKFLAVEDVMMNDETGALWQLMSLYLNGEDLASFNQNILKTFTLSNIVNHLTILNGEKIIDDVEEIVKDLEFNLNEELDSTRKLGLYVHISCLIERLILKQGISEVEGMNEELEAKKDVIEKVRDAFSGAEMRYSVEIPDVEVLYVLNYFNKS